MRDRNQFKVGIVGLVVLASLIAAAINFNALRSVLNDTQYRAELAETGGLQKGDDVRLAGVNIGTVKSIDLQTDHISVGFSAAGLHMGTQTTASVKSDNALGRKFLSISPAGPGGETTIPISQTDAGYEVTVALGDLTKTARQLDVKQMAKSFDALAQVLNRTPRSFRAALSGVSALSRTIAGRDAGVRSLFRRASSLSGVLADRNVQIISLLGKGGLLFAELDRRRTVIAELLRSVGYVTRQLSGFVADNRSSMRPALVQIRGVATLLKRYRSTLDYALSNLGSFVSGLGEAVGSGPFFQAYVQNLTSPTSLVPMVNSIVDGNG